MYQMHEMLVPPHKDATYLFFSVFGIFRLYMALERERLHCLGWGKLDAPPLRLHQVGKTHAYKRWTLQPNSSTTSSTHSWISSTAPSPMPSSFLWTSWECRQVRPTVHHVQPTICCFIFDFANEFRPTEVFFFIDDFFLFIAITVLGTSCCPTGQTGLCMPNSTPCPDRSTYAFFDGFHPTEVVNQGLAGRAYHASSTTDTYPTDISHLVTS